MESYAFQIKAAFESPYTVPEVIIRLKKAAEASQGQFKVTKFLAFFSHMVSVHFGFFLWLWKESGENFDNWIDQAIDTGNIACQMDPSNLFAKAINRYGIESADVRAHKESCAAFWRAVPIDQWEHGHVGDYFFYVLAGDEMYRTGLKGY